MTPEVAARKYLPSMRTVVKEIERRWSVANKARGKIA
jgi:IclR family mhp operon transcriptional activator